MAEKEAAKLIKQAKFFYAAKGKKIVSYDLEKDKPKEADLIKLMLGPTGNLRAPTILKGNKLIIGFNYEMYQDILE
jgi:arsenate reductase-like glutaredoxin family protein